MPHRFLVKDIAFQAGLSTATVDRMLNGRGGVRGQTIARINAAIHELEQQEINVARGGKSFIVDVVMEAPERFTSEVRAAFEREAGSFYPNMFRMRLQNAEVLPQDEFIRYLDRIRLRGSDGVIVKAPAIAGIEHAIDRLREAGIAAIALVTDLPKSNRLAYVGVDNNKAGATAAYLIATALGARNGTVLVTLSSNRFYGEEERVTGFRNAVAARYPTMTIVEISEGFGRDEQTGKQVSAALAANPDICAVYSAGGGNRAITDAFERANRTCRAFIAHDLDTDNRALLKDGRLSFVLHHDLNIDARGVYRKLLEHHRRLPPSNLDANSQLMIISPFNVI